MKILAAAVTLLLAILFGPPAAAAQVAGPSVRAPDGVFLGVATATGRRFLGVRYAQPPLGPLRWAAPKPAAAAPGEQSARHLGSACVQPVDGWNFNPRPGDRMKGSEDCLFLNIYAPRAAGPKRPVMVWLHGGGFVTGSGNEYDGHILAEEGNVLVVTVNYRLGALGFLSHPALGAESGNFGLLDQQMALRWIGRNIAAFGGDPSRVTIFGESAGGVAVCAHLVSPGARGLFSRAIIESGPCLAFPRPAADLKGERYAGLAGCPARGEETLPCLRAIPAFKVSAISPAETGIGDTAWTLVAGTPVLPDLMTALRGGAFAHVPVLNGSNRDEGRLFAFVGLPRMGTRDAYERNARIQFGAGADRILAAYPATAYRSPALAFASYMTDFLFACPALQANTAMARYTPVYAYEFADRTGRFASAEPAEIAPLGAYHAKEVQFVFRTPSFFSGTAAFSPDQLRLSRRMMAAWTSFARNGVPTIPGETWQPMKAEAPWIKSLDTLGDAPVARFAEDHRCAFWSSL